MGAATSSSQGLNMTRRKPKMKIPIKTPTEMNVENMPNSLISDMKEATPKTIDINELSGTDPCVPLIIDDLPNAEDNKSVSESNSEFANRIQVLVNERDELKNQYIRLKADFENYRKHEADRQSRAKSVGREVIVEALLPVFESLGKALDLCKPETSMEGLREGLDISIKLFKKVLMENGVQIFCEPNDVFDPLMHLAVSKDEVESPAECEEIVSQVYQSGIIVNGRVFKPAMVKVGYKPKSDGNSETKSANDNVNNADCDLTS